VDYSLERRVDSIIASQRALVVIHVTSFTSGLTDWVRVWGENITVTLAENVVKLPLLKLWE
jgi:hypothetical protein